VSLVYVSSYLQSMRMTMIDGVDVMIPPKSTTQTTQLLTQLFSKRVEMKSHRSKGNASRVASTRRMIT
jgi:hypothetical protein